MPSRMELLKLYSNPTMRKAAESMVEALSSAGIEFDQEVSSKIQVTHRSTDLLPDRHEACEESSRHARQRRP